MTSSLFLPQKMLWAICLELSGHHSLFSVHMLFPRVFLEFFHGLFPQRERPIQTITLMFTIHYLNSRANGSLITPITFTYSLQSREYWLSGRYTRESNGSTEWLRVWNYFSFFRALNFQISEPEIWGISLFLLLFGNLPGNCGL